MLRSALVWALHLSSCQLSLPQKHPRANSLKALQTACVDTNGDYQVRRWCEAGGHVAADTSTAPQTPDHLVWERKVTQMTWLFKEQERERPRAQSGKGGTERTNGSLGYRETQPLVGKSLYFMLGLKGETWETDWIRPTWLPCVE